MTRKRLFLPALLVGTGLFATAGSANAQGVRIGVSVGPRPVVAAPVVVRPHVRVAPAVIAQPVIVARPVYPAPIVAPHCDTYQVLYRECSHDPWQTYRVYHSLHRAREAARDLRYAGYQARVID